MLAALFSSSRGIVFSIMISNRAFRPPLSTLATARLEVAAYFKLGRDEARKIAAEVGHAVATWRREVKKLGLTAAEIDRMASSFEHQDLKEALASAAHHLP